MDEIKKAIQDRRDAISRNITESIGSDIEKARNVGDIHPTKPWAWTEYAPGKFDWRVAKKSESDDEISRKTYKNLYLLMDDLHKNRKGVLYHVNGEKATFDSVIDRIKAANNDNGLISILDITGSSGYNQINSEEMKDNNVAGSYGIIYQKGQISLATYKVNQNPNAKSPDVNVDVKKPKLNYESFSFESYMKKYPNEFKGVSIKDVEFGKINKNGIEVDSASIFIGNKKDIFTLGDDGWSYFTSK